MSVLSPNLLCDGSYCCKVSQRLFAKALVGLSSMALLCVAGSPIACAQDYSVPAGFDPPAIASDHNGVDLFSGHIVIPAPKLQIAGDPRLTLKNINDLNMVMSLTKATDLGGALTAIITYNKGDGASETFDCSTDYYVGSSVPMPCVSHASLPSYAKGPDGHDYYEARTGRHINYGMLYDMIPSGANCVVSTGACAITPIVLGSKSIFLASSVSYADGETLSISYDSTSINTTIPVTNPGTGLPTGGYVTASIMRPSKVTSNRGFEMDIVYQTNTWDPNSSTVSIAWLTPATVSIYAIGNYAQPLASIRISLPDATGNQTITDMNGNNWYGYFLYVYGGLNTTWAGSLTPPTSSTPSLNATSNACENSTAGTGSTAYTTSSQLLTSLVKGSDTWTYNYSNAVPLSQCYQSGTALGNVNRSVTISGPNGYQRTVRIDQGGTSTSPAIVGVSPVISSDTDSLNRTVNYQYAYLATNPNETFSWGRVLSEIDYPEGNKELFSYDWMGNVTQHQKVPKPGSPLSTLVLQASYPPATACAPWQFTMVNSVWSPPSITCTRPLWTKDANGNETDYTWDPNTGMMLTETQPAGASGVRPQVRYSYTQRSAWYSNGSGGYVEAASPIWVKTSESRCQNSAATGNAAAPCSGNDEILTTYSYGPDSGPNYLWMRGKTVSSNGLAVTTCYTYDALGNKISETQPNGTNGSCP